MKEKAITPWWRQRGHGLVDSVRLVAGSPRLWRTALPLIVTVCYLAAFIPLEHRFGDPAEALSLIPVVVTAWSNGWRPGATMAILAWPTNALLLHLAGVASWSSALGQAAGPGLLGTIVIGAAVGWLRERAWRLDTEVHRREQAEHDALEALRSSEARHRALATNATDLVVILTRSGHVSYASPSHHRLLGYSPEDLMGHHLSEYLHADDLALVRASVRPFQKRNVFQTLSVRIRRQSGEWRTFEATVTDHLTDPSIGGWLVNAHDVTERMLFETELHYHAFHDALTNLPNRELFQVRLESSLDEVRQQRHKVIVLFLDLDRFKVVNDSLGHEAGDQLLIAVSSQLQSCLRKDDTLARLGGDEFAVLLSTRRDIAEAAHVANHIIDVLGSPLLLGDHEVVVSTSIGIATSNAASTVVDMMREADMALYRAKSRGRGCFDIFDAAMNAQAVERLALEAELRTALEQGEFVVYYQPKMQLVSGHCTGMEALVRWQSPKRGLVPPLEFIALCEETGLIRPLGRWVFEEACKQAYHWNAGEIAQMSRTLPLTISVNLSAQQLLHPNLIDDLAQALERSGASPAWLQLEITESTAMSDAEANVKTLQQLKGLGVKLALDDFGTGYSSLAYLKRFPIDVLKVDRSFVTGLHTNGEDAAIVATIIGLAQALGLTVVAEGVETEQDAKELQALGCEIGQGYYWARPLTPEQANTFVMSLAEQVSVA